MPTDRAERGIIRPRQQSFAGVARALSLAQVTFVTANYFDLRRRRPKSPMRSRAGSIARREKEGER